MVDDVRGTNQAAVTDPSEHRFWSQVATNCWYTTSRAAGFAFGFAFGNFCCVFLGPHSYLCVKINVFLSALKEHFTSAPPCPLFPLPKVLQTAHHDRSSLPVISAARSALDLAQPPTTHRLHPLILNRLLLLFPADMIVGPHLHAPTLQNPHPASHPRCFNFCFVRLCSSSPMPTVRTLKPTLTARHHLDQHDPRPNRLCATMLFPK